MSVDVRVEALTKRFDGFTALDNVSLTAAQGELVALLGPSGSGKTSLLRIVAGLEQADAGQVYFGGIEASGLDLRKRRIGLVFQSYALFKHMNVADNIAFGLRTRARKERPGEAAIRSRVSDLLDLVQLSGLEKRLPAQLSGGQRQRVALARALAIEPRVLLLDEPFGALDSRIRKDLRRWLRNLHDRTGHTTLFVTHDQEEALDMADRVAILHRGRLEQTGTADEVYDHPATPFVCAFLGDSNLLPVQIRAGEVYFANTALPGLSATTLAGDASLYVRPHHLSLAPAGEAGLNGTVRSLRRTGATRHADIEIAGLVTPLSMVLPDGPVPGIGERVALRFARANLFASAE